MTFKELGAELVSSVREGLDIMRGKRDAARAHLPPDRPAVRSVAGSDTRRDAEADQE